MASYSDINKLKSVLQVLADGANLDIRLVGYNGEVNAHRIILTSMSPFLFDLILHCKDEQPTIHIPDFSVECIQHFMYFIYCGEVVINAEQLTDLNECANTLGINLQNITAEPLKISNNITVNDTGNLLMDVVVKEECTIEGGNYDEILPVQSPSNYFQQTSKVEVTDDMSYGDISELQSLNSSNTEQFEPDNTTQADDEENYLENSETPTSDSVLNHTEQKCSNSSITCNLCGVCLSTRTNLFRHKRNCHGVCCTEMTFKCKEDNCGFDCYVMKNLREHLRILHNYSFPMKTM